MSSGAEAAWQVPADTVLNSARDVTDVTNRRRRAAKYFVEVPPDEVLKAKRQQDHNEAVKLLYLGNQPSTRLDDIESNCDTIRARFMDEWRSQGLTEDVIASRSTTLNRWLDEQKADIFLGRDPAQKARDLDLDSDFATAMTRLSEKMAQLDSGSVRQCLVNINRTPEHQYRLSEFFRHDRSLQGHFFETLLVHLVDHARPTSNPFTLLPMDSRSDLEEPLRRLTHATLHRISATTSKSRSFSGGTERAAKQRLQFMRKVASQWTRPSRLDGIINTKKSKLTLGERLVRDSKKRVVFTPHRIEFIAEEGDEEPSVAHTNGDCGRSHSQTEEDPPETDRPTSSYSCV